MHLDGLPNLLGVVQHERLDELNKHTCFNYITVISESCLWPFPPVPCRALVHDFRHCWWRGLMDLNIHFLHQHLFAAALRFCPQQWSCGQIRFLIELAFTSVCDGTFSPLHLLSLQLLSSLQLVGKISCPKNIILQVPSFCLCAGTKGALHAVLLKKKLPLAVRIGPEQVEQIS